MPDSSRTLADFLLSHCSYLSDPALLGLTDPSRSQHASINSHSGECPICIAHFASEENPDQRIIQINLSSCRHSFCSECLSHHILAGYNTCPLCRTVWFDIPQGATTVRSDSFGEDHRLQQLEHVIHDIMLAIVEHTQDGAQSLSRRSLDPISNIILDFLDEELRPISDDEESSDDE